MLLKKYRFVQNILQVYNDHMYDKHVQARTMGIV
jgi:hypothetical protein